jgi:predicted ATPase/DNA-binding SARP family transcriptional activator
VELLGPLRVVRSGQEITRFRTQKTALLLGALALHRDRAHARESLIERVWPGAAPETGRNNLRIALSSLRRQLEPPGVPAGTVVVADRSSVRLNALAHTTDLADFQAALGRAGTAARELERRQALESAVSLHRGELLAGLHADWLAGERDRLLAAFRRAIHELVGAFERARDYPRAVELARLGVQSDEGGEAACRDLMRVLSATGERREALRHYKGLERYLARELGVAPMPVTAELAREIERAARAPASSPAPPPAAPSEAPPGDRRGPSRVTMATFLAAESAHGSILDEVAREHGGSVQERDGARVLRFGAPSAALAAAFAARRLEAGAPAPRMAIHAGETDDGPGGPAVEHALRLLVAARPRQVLCSHAASALLANSGTALPAELHDLGRFWLRGASAPERLSEARLAGETEPPRAPDAEPGYSGRVPLALTRFFAREEELAQVEALLPGRTRLLTVTGPGGVGKTRLAMEAATRLRPRFRNAVWFVPVAGEPTALGHALADALGLERSPDPLATVARTLGSDPALFVLDGFEHLLPVEPAVGRASRPPSQRAGETLAPPTPVTAVLSSLLERASGVSLLVTSRRPLAIAGETELALVPLPVPGQAGSPSAESPDALAPVASVALFVDRAQARRPDFQLTAANAATISELCRRLEGIPLALELAAGCAHELGPAQLLARLGDRIDAFVARERDVAPQHRTLRASIDASYRSLTAPLQRFFARLSVFRGGFTVDAAAAVCELAPDVAREQAAALREHSLLMPAGADELRYRLLDTLAEYASGLLEPKERKALARRHAEHFALLAERAFEGFTSPEQITWLARIAADAENFSAALQTSLDEPGKAGGERALRLAGSLAKYWSLRRERPEGRRWHSAALARTRGRTKARLRALMGAAGFEGDVDAKEKLLAEALRAARALGDRGAEGTIENSLSVVAYHRSDLDEAERLSTKALAIARELGDRNGAGSALFNLSSYAESRARYARAYELHVECLATSRAVGGRQQISAALVNGASIAIKLGDYSRARTLLEESLAVAAEVSDLARGIPLGFLGYLELTLGNATAARSALEASIAITRKTGDAGQCATSEHQMAEVFELEGRPDLALHQIRRMIAIHRESRRGEAPEALVDGLLTLGSLLRSSDRRGAREAFAEGLLLLEKETPKPSWARAFEEIATIALEVEDAASAAQLLGAGLALRESIGVPVFPRHAALRERAIAAALEALGARELAAATRRGRALSWKRTIALAKRVCAGIGASQVVAASGPTHNPGV